MTNKCKSNKVIAIVGQTASGKTNLSIKIAQKFNGEIINADSRSIYKYCDIATAKPTVKEQSGIPHYLFDLIEPNKVYTVSKYKKQAEKIIKKIHERGKIPIIVGGTGLYIDALLKNYSFPIKSDIKLRQELFKYSNEQLLHRLDSLDKEALNENDRKNKRRVIRALEVCLLSGKKFSQLKKQKKSKYDILWLGIDWRNEQLKKRLFNRAKKMIEDGVLEETQRLMEKYPKALKGNLPAMTSIGYPIWHKYLNKQISLKEALEIFSKADWQLARRQKTWFKRNKDIIWLRPHDALKQAQKLVNTFID